MDPDASTVEGKLREAQPESDLSMAVARARVAAKLFGDAEPIKVGRYSLIEKAGAGGMGVVWQAYDPELGRAVALKLASSSTDEAIRARARDEGRALAKLSHPNVVPIYDVIEVEDGVFLVMELVKGKTLRSLEGETPIIRAYRQAGEGLAAAHEAGLIHRDFKPDNAIMGADGRVRVLDFGLAQESTSETTEVAGTPRYMAPEQREGKQLTAAVDQFALCASLREALSPLPRWLEPIIARGTAEEPSARYPSMRELLHALALDPRTRWRRRAAIGGTVIALGSIALAFTLGRANREDACEGGPQMIASAWGSAARAGVAQHLGALQSSFAADATPRMLARLDDYAKGWLRVHRASCEAHRRGEISSDLLDRRAGCLARTRSALTTMSELAGKGTEENLPKLVDALAELPDLAACDDDDALVANVKPPAREIATEATAITELVARADVQRDAGQFEGATRDADAALARARALKYRPLVARALLTRGRITLSMRGPGRGIEHFEEATREAMASGDEVLGVEAFARHAWTVGIVQAKADRATDGLPLVEAILERLADRAAFARALLHMNLGGIAMAAGDRAKARELLERARHEASAVTGSGAIELTTVLSSLLIVVDDPAVREQLSKEILETRTRLLGTLHPTVLKTRMLVANSIEDAGAARAALWPVCGDLARHYPQLGPFISECAYEVAWLAFVAGDSTNAKLAATLATEAKGEKHQVAAATAIVQLVDGNREEATRTLQALRDYLAKEPPTWWNQFFLGDVAILEAVAGDRAALAKAETSYAQIGDALPAPIRARRAAVVKALKGSQ